MTFYRKEKNLRLKSHDVRTRIFENFSVTNPSGDAGKNQTPPTLLSSLRSVLFVIGTVVIGFAAVCNSLTWHLQRFWGASGDFWQAQWDKILNKLGDDPVTLWVYGKQRERKRKKRIN